MRRFALVWVGSWLCFFSIGAVLTVLPRYVTKELGGGDVAVGLVVGAFAFSAVVARPLAGRLADAHGRRVVVLAGAVLIVCAGALYPIAGGVVAMVVARVVLGFGEGLVFTAGAAWTMDLAPLERRGRAIGMYGLSIWTGLSVGPPVGEGLLSLGGYDAVWALAIVSPILGSIVFALAGDQASGRESAQREKAGGVAPGRGPWMPPEVIRPGIALLLANIGFTALAGFISLHLGESDGPAVFTAFAIAVVVTRVAFGGLPDRIGARRCAVAAAAAEAIGLLLLGAADGLALGIAGGVVMGAGFSTLYPALSLIAVERVPDERRGAAIGMFSAYFDVGVGIGGPLMGLVAAGAGYEAAFWLGTVLAAAAALLTARPAPRARPA